MNKLEKDKESREEGQNGAKKGYHVLSRAFVFSFKQQKQTKPDQKSYKDLIQTIGSFNTIEGFWSYYCQINRPDQLPDDCDINLFQEGVQPMWEDESNRGGGRFILRVKKPFAGKFWEDLLIGFIGEQCPENDCITGLVLSVRGPEVLLSLWTKQITDTERDAIDAWIRATLELSEHAEILYKLHRSTVTERSDNSQKHQKPSERKIERNEEFKRKQILDK